MDIRSSLFFVMFQLLNIAMAEWNPNTPLYLVDIPIRNKTFTKIFPLEIPSTARQNDLDNATYYAFCPNFSTANTNCNYGNLFNGVSQSMTGQFENICLDPVVYNVARYLNRHMEHEPCFINNEQGHIYHFVYFLCQDGDPEELPRGEKIIYQVCYQDHEKQMFFASAAIENPSLLRDARLQDERTYEFALDTSHWFNDYTRDIINASTSLYGREESNYTPTFVLPTAFSPFAHQRKTFFHYMNVAPMESTLTDVWDFFLNKLVVEKLSWIESGIHVYAGLLGVLQDGQGNVVYLGEYNGKQEIPIPRIFWIMIASKTQYSGVAIMIHNINYSTVEIQPNQVFNHVDCSAKVCEDANLADIMPSSQFPVYIVCCMPKAINEYFDLRIRNTLLEFPPG